MTLSLGVVLVLLLADVALTSSHPLARSLSAVRVSTAIETAVGMAFLVSGWVVMSRFTRTRTLADLTLATALCLLGGSAVVALIFTAAPALGASRLDRILLVASRLLAVGLLAIAPHVPDRRVRHPRHATTAGLAVGAFVAAILATATAESAWRPSAGGSHLSADAALRGSSGTQLVAGALLLVAAWGLADLRSPRGDPLLRWFAGGAFLLAAARLEAALPVAAHDLPPPGALLRLAGSFAFLVGAAKEVQSYQRRLREATLREERHRVARELHDGLAQDLAHVVCQARWLAGRYDEPALQEIAGASEHALQDSRAAIAGLRLDQPGSVRAAVTAAAQAAADRAGLELDLTLAALPEEDAEAAHDLAGIVVEAIRNAARHGAARRIRVHLDTERGHPVLRVSDDGRGFDPGGAAAASHHGHWGLVTMRERAAALGGDLHVSSSPAGGTTIEVRLP